MPDEDLAYDASNPKSATWLDDLMDVLHGWDN